MAGGALGKLNVLLGLDSTEFTAGLSKADYTARQKLDSIAANAAKVGVAFAVMGAAAVATLSIVVKKSIDNMDAMSKLAQSTGTTTEKLSALAYAADLSGINQEALSSAMVKLTKNMSDASMGTGEAIKGFQALGIQLKDSSGALRSSEEVLGDLADKFANMQDGAGKTALAVNLFGKSGAQMIPLLNSGRDGLAEMAAEASKLGLIISTEAAQAAEVFNDNLSRLQKSLDGLAIQVASAVLPVMNDFVQAFIDTRNESNKMLDAAKDLSNDNSIQDWAQNTALVLAIVYDSASTVVDGLVLVGSSVRAVALDSKAALATMANILPEWGVAGLMAKGAGIDISDEGTAKVVAEAAKARTDIERQLKAIWNKPLLYDTLTENFANEELKFWTGAGAAFGSGVKQLAPNIVKGDGPAKKPERNYIATDLDEMLIRMGAMSEPIDAMGVQLKETTNDMSEFAIQAQRNISSSLGDGLYNILTGKFDDIGANFADMLLKMATDAAGANLGEMLFGGKADKGMGGLFGTVLGALGGSFGGGGNLTGSSLSGASWTSAVKFAGGGHVPGSGNGDTVPAWLTPGEFVMTKKATQAIGAHRLESMNNRFANGGLVGGTASTGGSDAITIINQTTGRIDKVTEQRLSPTERAIIIQEAVEATASSMNNPNSRVSKAVQRNTSAQRTR